MSRPKTVDSEALKEDFITSACTLRELASRHDASYSLVTKLASKEKWSQQRNEGRKALAKDIRSLAPVSPECHVERSKITGDQIHHLMTEAMAAIKSGDIRALKTLVDAWASWDNQMRKTHRLDDGRDDKPIIDIHILSSLPDTPTYIDDAPQA